MSIDGRSLWTIEMGDSAVDVIKEAELLISNANLPHPSPSLLSCFIYNALKPKVTASYIIDACRASNDPTTELMSLVESWTFIVEASKLIIFLASIRLPCDHNT